LITFDPADSETIDFTAFAPSAAAVIHCGRITATRA
jgi:hypothetical protein